MSRWRQSRVDLTGAEFGAGDTQRPLDHRRYGSSGSARGGRARSGCGAAIVGDPDQVAAKIRRYEELGIEALILSGYPHKEEAELFARHVLPQLDHAPL